MTCAYHVPKHDLMLIAPGTCYCTLCRSPAELLQGTDRYISIGYAQVNGYGDMVHCLKVRHPLWSPFLYGCFRGLYAPFARYVFVYNVLNVGFQNEDVSSTWYSLTMYAQYLRKQEYLVPRSTHTLLYTEVTGHSAVRCGNLLGTRNSGNTTRAILYAVLLSTMLPS